MPQGQWTMDDLKTDTAEKEAEKPSILSDFFALSGGFWRGESAMRAWTLTFLVIASQLAQIGGQVGLNAWNRIFFDALERKDLAEVWVAIAWVPFVVAGIAASVSALVVTRMLFQTRWREWLTDRIAGWWIADQRYYRLGFIAPNQSAPEYRIADDVRLARGGGGGGGGGGGRGSGAAAAAADAPSPDGANAPPAQVGGGGAVGRGRVDDVPRAGEAAAQGGGGR